jgi:hypothetical protein
MTIQERARRIITLLDEADEGGYGKTAWYSYLHRADVEALARAAVDWVPPVAAEQLTIPLVGMTNGDE